MKICVFIMSFAHILILHICSANEHFNHDNIHLFMREYGINIFMSYYASFFFAYIMRVTHLTSLKSND